MEPDAVKQRAALAWEERPEHLRHEGWKYIEKVMYMWGFSAGYRAGLAASPSEERMAALIEAAEKALPEFESAASCVHHEFDGIADMTEMDAAIDTLTAALAALRTTKEEE